MYKVSGELLKESKSKLQKALKTMIAFKAIDYNSKEAREIQALIDKLEVEYYV